MKILWLHNWPDQRKTMGPFMWTVYEKLKDSGHHIDMHYLDAKRGFFSLLTDFISLKKRAKQYDLIHSQYGSLVGFIGSRLGRPFAITIRGSDWHRYKGRNFREFIHSLVATWLTRQALKNCIHVIVMSRRMANELAELDGKISKTVISDPIDFSLFQKMNRSTCRAKLGHSNDESPWILFNTLSKNNPVKRLDLAKAAIAEVKKTYPEAKLKIATGIQYVEMPVFINSCDLALCTSTHEGWPNSIKEALACNLPFVSTDVSDLKEISLKYKSCKVTAPDPIDIGKAIVDVLSNKEQEKYDQLFKLFDLEESSRKYMAIYQEIQSDGRII